jgi:uncharacterized protein with FMN-binding domain
MVYPRLARGAAACALCIALSGALVSCAVNKADLARRVDLKNVDLAGVADGTYEGSYTIQPPLPAMAANKSVQVRVMVAAGRYAKIEILQPAAIQNSKGMQTLISRVEESQILSVDAVSSATITSTAVLKAIQNAVSSPKR